ncbi:MAG: hypothetical protein ACKOT0_00850 [bacterium]
MATRTVVLTPGASYDVPPMPGVAVLDMSALACDGADWTARAALGIQAASPAAPLLLVAAGSRARHAPALGFAQRAARRAVGGYVLVDPELPAPRADWPDAPVTVVVTPHADDDTRTSALAARLRGWEVLESDAVTAIEDVATRP